MTRMVRGVGRHVETPGVIDGIGVPGHEFGGAFLFAFVFDTVEDVSASGVGQDSGDVRPDQRIFGVRLWVPVVPTELNVVRASGIESRDNPLGASSCISGV